MKEETADELFEKLNYEKYDNHPEHDFPPKLNTLIEKFDLIKKIVSGCTQDVRRLYYEQKGILKNGLEAIEHIEFDLIRKNVVCWAKINGRFTIVPLSMQELQAINKKREELGWKKNKK